MSVLLLQSNEALEKEWKRNGIKSVLFHTLAYKGIMQKEKNLSFFIYVEYHKTTMPLYPKCIMALNPCASKCIFHNWATQKEHEQSNDLNISLSMYEEWECHHKKETLPGSFKSTSHNWVQSVRSSGGYHPQQEKCVANRKSHIPAGLSSEGLADSKHW